MRLATLLLAAAAAAAAAAALPRAGAAAHRVADWTYYHRTDDLLARVKLVAERLPELVQLDVLREAEGGSEGEEPVPVLRMTNPGVRPGGRQKIKALVVAGEHGRELIGPETVLWVLEQVERSWLLRQRGEATRMGEWLFALMEHTELVLVPCVNPWGRRRAEGPERCSRKSRGGADLNRNWDHRWSADPEGKGAPRPPSHEEYPGAAPFSEWESRALRDLAFEVTPDLYVNVHSGVREMYMGWDDRAELVPNHEEVAPLLRHLNASYCRCKFGGGGEIGGYAAAGTSMDYVYEEVGARFSLTFELYGGEGPPEDCFAFFNPATRAAYDATVRDWGLAILAAPAFLAFQDGANELEQEPLARMLDGPHGAVAEPRGGGGAGPAPGAADAAPVPPIDPMTLLLPLFGVAIGAAAWYTNRPAQKSGPRSRDLDV